MGIETIARTQKAALSMAGDGRHISPQDSVSASASARFCPNHARTRTHVVIIVAGFMLAHGTIYACKMDILLCSVLWRGADQSDDLLFHGIRGALEPE